MHISPIACGLFTMMAFTAATNLGCSSTKESESVDVISSGFSSRDAELLDFEFDGELTIDADTGIDIEDHIVSQLLFTIGHLNGDGSVGRLDDLKIDHVSVAPNGGGKEAVRYHASMPVAWGSKTQLPRYYEFVLPRDISTAAEHAFTERYKKRCVAKGDHDIDDGSIWYYFRPYADGCRLDPRDVVSMTATVTRSSLNTSGKYPEYDQIWADNELDVVAIFGAYEDVEPSDEGVGAYADFLRAVAAEFAGNGVVQNPSVVRRAASSPDVEFSAPLPDGRGVHITALLVNRITDASESFWERYETLSAKADLIAYNGHAGLGQNVRALASRGRWVRGKYVILYMNGCDTFAYVDGSLARTRAAINPDDPTGTKYMEFITNAMPSFFSTMSNVSMALTKGLLQYAKPLTYEEIFATMPPTGVILVTGENDNTFHP